MKVILVFQITVGDVQYHTACHTDVANLFKMNTFANTFMNLFFIKFMVDIKIIDHGIYIVILAYVSVHPRHKQFHVIIITPYAKYILKYYFFFKCGGVKYLLSNAL